MKSIFKRLSIAALVALVATFYVFANEKKMSILEGQPVFEIKLDAFGTGYFVTVNGVTIIREYSADGQLSTVLPINHFMHPSENKFKVFVLPGAPGRDFLPGARIKVDLQLRDNNKEDSKYIIPIINFTSSELGAGDGLKRDFSQGEYALKEFGANENNGDNEIFLGNILTSPIDEYEGGIQYEREIKVQNSLPMWKFHSSETLPDYYQFSDEKYDEVVSSLFQEYERVQRALKAGSVDDIIYLFRERSSEIDEAFYLEPGTTSKNLLSSFKRSASSSELRLSELNKDWVGITLEEGKKLVSLTREGETSAIGFDSVTGGSTSYPITFRKEKGKWIITR